MIPTLFSIGPFPIHSFGLMVVLACVAAWRSLFLELEAAGRRVELAERMVTRAAIAGIICARLGFLFTFHNELFAHPMETIFSSAGFVFHWGFVGGVVSLWLLLRKENEDFLSMADLSGPALAIGYGIGRIGCQLSGDGDYGRPSNLPWAMEYPLGVVPTPPGVAVHPTPIYETIGALMIAAILLAPWVRRTLKGKGQRFGLYLLLTALARFLVEYVRVEPVILPPLTQAQLMSLLLAPIAAVLLVRGRARA